VFLIMFNTVQALPLRKRRTWCPRMSRGINTEYPRKINRSWTWHWPVHGLDSAGDRTRPGTFRVREQAASAFSPQQQSWPRTIHAHARARASIVRHQATVADENYPQTVRSREQSTSPNRPRTRFLRDRGPAKNRPHRCIAVSILPSVNFPVHVRIIPAYDLI
jgi:hypothetical protein